MFLRIFFHKKMPYLGSKAQLAFQNLKTAMTKSPVLALLGFSKHLLFKLMHPTKEWV